MVRRKDPTRYTTQYEVRRGIYIDFEGYENHPPALTGVLCEDQLEQVVFCTGIANAADAKGLRVASFEGEIERIIERCEEEDRKLFAFSRHEWNKVSKYTELGESFGLVFRDGHKVAKRWYNRLKMDDPSLTRPDHMSLQFLAGIIGFDRPKYLGDKIATSRLRYVLEMLKKRGSYESLTPVAKGKWTKLLSHNEWDCRALQQLMITVSDSQSK